MSNGDSTDDDVEGIRQAFERARSGQRMELLENLWGEGAEALLPVWLDLRDGLYRKQLAVGREDPDAYLRAVEGAVTHWVHVVVLDRLEWAARILGKEMLGKEGVALAELPEHTAAWLQMVHMEAFLTYSGIVRELLRELCQAVTASAPRSKDDVQVCPSCLAAECLPDVWERIQKSLKGNHTLWKGVRCRLREGEGGERGPDGGLA